MWRHNGRLLSVDKDILSVVQTLDSGCAAWLNGKRLEPGDRLRFGNTLVYEEPQEWARLDDEDAEALRERFDSAASKFGSSAA